MTELEYQREFVSKLLTRIDDLEFIIRDISLFVSAGGFNSDEVPADANKRIKEAIVSLVHSTASVTAKRLELSYYKDMQKEVKQAWTTEQVVSTETIENDLELTLSEIGLTVTEEQAAKLVEFTKRYIEMAVESFNW